MCLYEQRDMYVNKVWKHITASVGFMYAIYSYF